MRLVVVWVALLAVLRGVLVAATRALDTDTTPAILAEACIRGLQFDLSIAVRLLVPFVLWRIWRSGAGGAERRVVAWLHGLLALVVTFTLVAEVEFYKEFQMRLGPLAFQFFGKPEHNAIVLGMIWDGYPVIRWALACVALWALFVVLARRAAPVAPIAADDMLARVLARALATVAWVAVVILGTRGGFQSIPIRWGDAAFSESAYANHMAQNGVFSLVDSLWRMRKGRSEAAGWLRKMPRDEAIALVRESTIGASEILVEPDRYPLLRRSVPSPLPLHRRPKNVVLIMMESFTARFCGATGAGFGATPRFDALAKEGILFDRAFSASTHTAQGVFSILSSFPNVADYETVMKHPLGTQRFLTLPEILSGSGFETLFLCNGLFSWDNMEGFFRTHGVDRFIGRHDYVDPSFVDSNWGVCDGDVFDRATQEFDALAAGGKPFLGLVLTLSNHAPFSLPEVPGLVPVANGGDQAQRLRGVQYADWALGRFFDGVRGRPWARETLFVMVGDHGFGIPPVLTDVNLLHEHVPLLFWGPGILASRGEVRATVAGHLDVLPTVLGIVGEPLLHQSFGRDLFSLPEGAVGHAWVKQCGDPVAGWIEGSDILTASLDRRSRLHRFDLGFPPSASADRSLDEAARASDLERSLRAFAIVAIDTLESRLAAPTR